MSEELNPQVEYRRRRGRVVKGVLLMGVLPFALTVLGWYMAAPQVFLSIAMGATLLGILVSVLYVLRVWRCPACGKSLAAGGGTLGGKCVHCDALLYTPRRSKDGSRLYQ